MRFWAACLLVFLPLALLVFVGCAFPANVNRKSIAVLLRAACLLLILAVHLSVCAGTIQRTSLEVAWPLTGIHRETTVTAPVLDSARDNAR
jgi:hypothetical protein